MLQHDLQALHPGDSPAAVPLFPAEGDTQPVGQPLPGQIVQLVGVDQHAVQIKTNSLYHGVCTPFVHGQVSWYSEGEIPTTFLKVAEK